MQINLCIIYSVHLLKLRNIHTEPPHTVRLQSEFQADLKHCPAVCHAILPPKLVKSRYEMELAIVFSSQF